MAKHNHDEILAAASMAMLAAGEPREAIILHFLAAAEVMVFNGWIDAGAYAGLLEERAAMFRNHATGRKN